MDKDKKHQQALEYARRYYRTHRSEKREYAMRYWKEHSTRMKEGHKRWKKEHPNYWKNYQEEHQGRLREIDKNWQENHKEERRIIRRRYNAKRGATLQGKLENRMRTGIWSSLRKNKAGRKWEELVGYTANDLKEHLEKQFKNGLTWDIFFEEGYHIDHIKPQSLFHYETPEDDEFQECWALENLQPLKRKENLIKGNRYESV